METNKIPTSSGLKSIGEIMEILAYNSYAAQRDYGMTHERAVRLFSMPDDVAVRFAEKYEAENN